MEVASFEDGNDLGVATFDPTRQPSIQFDVWQGCKVYTVPHLILRTKCEVRPPGNKNSLIEKGVVLLPSRAAEYGSQAELVAEIVVFIHRYADVPDFWEDLIAHYVLMTWVYDKFTAVPYLRFFGEPQSGKTRCLQIAGQLSYKAIFGAGATTVSPLFRLLEVYHGTFVLDEADYKITTEWSEIVKILNAGYMRGIPVLRSDKDGDSYEPRAFDVFGPKIMSTVRTSRTGLLKPAALLCGPRKAISAPISRANYPQSSLPKRWNFGTNSCAGGLRTTRPSRPTSHSCSTWNRGLPRSGPRSIPSPAIRVSARGS
jgi:hypothetical protein